MRTDILNQSGDLKFDYWQSEHERKRIIGEYSMIERDCSIAELYNRNRSRENNSSRGVIEYHRWYSIEYEERKLIHTTQNFEWILRRRTVWL